MRDFRGVLLLRCPDALARAGTMPVHGPRGHGKHLASRNREYLLSRFRAHRPTTGEFAKRRENQSILTKPEAGHPEAIDATPHAQDRLQVSRHLETFGWLIGFVTEGSPACS